MLKMPKVNIVLDASKYDMFRLCEARYNFRYNLNIQLPGKATPLDRGSLVHVGCEVYYQSLQSGANYDYAVGAALSKIREYGVTSTDLEPEMISRVIDTMEEYFDYWRVADQQFTIDQVEKPFMYLLHEDENVRIYLSGKIDLVVSDNKYTNLPYDHKSNDRNYEVGRMSNQFKNYCVAVQSNYLIVNKIGFQKTLKPHEKFLRVPLSYDPIMLEEWKQNVIKTIMNNYLSCVTEAAWPMNETSCDKFNRRCEYYDICDSSGIEAKNYKINANYEPAEPWDVTQSMAKASELLDKKALVKADLEEVKET
jgi:hypothetical protein